MRGNIHLLTQYVSWRGASLSTRKALRKLLIWIVQNEVSSESVEQFCKIELSKRQNDMHDIQCCEAPP